MKKKKVESPENKIVLTKYDVKDKPNVIAEPTIYEFELNRYSNNLNSETSTRSSDLTINNNDILQANNIYTVLSPEQLSINEDYFKNKEETQNNFKKVSNKDGIGKDMNLVQNSGGYTNAAFIDNDSQRVVNYQEKKEEYFEKNSSNNIPKYVTLAWHSITITAQTKSLTERFINRLRCKKSIKKVETILNNVKGIVESGEMLALMGPRLYFNISFSN